MASYSQSNFLRSYASTDKAIQVQNQYGQKIFTINVCNYQKSFVNGKYLVVIGEDSDKQYQLDFATNSEALAAELTWKTAVDTLLANCTETETTVITGLTATPLTYTEYKDLANADGLNELTWYDISDTDDDLHIGSTIRVLAKTSSDVYPEGIVLDNKALVTLNVTEDKVQRYAYIPQKIIAENNSSVDYDGNSTNISVFNNSTLTVTDSDSIIVENNSSALVSQSSNIYIENSSTAIENAYYVKIYGISQDLSFASIAFNLSEVIIDANTTIGKTGVTLVNLTNIGSPQDIEVTAYDNTVTQIYTFTEDDIIVDLVLSNRIVQANSQFKIKLKLGVGVTNARLNVYTFGVGTPLYTMSEFHADTYAIFDFNRTTGQFEFIKLENTDNVSEKRIVLHPDSNNQTVFELLYLPTNGEFVKMFVNGQKITNGVDFTFTSPNIITYIGSDFNLTTSDEIEFFIG